ncbi:MAG: hypothetical protein H0U76_02335 [Ktedonobacteraceae bacterium]|nr:hypothetical protein [Ktedonobacteraceae bacterium]
MKKIRCFLATIALLISLSGIPLLQGGALTNAASSWQASTQHATMALHVKPNVPCPGGGTGDC